MKTRNPDDVVYIDVDYTLLLPEDVELFIPDSANKKLVEKIIKWHSEGRTIIIWTSNTRGVQHCKDAAKLCGIEDYIYDYLPKPKLIVDDNHLEYYRTMDPITFEVQEAQSRC